MKTKITLLLTVILISSCSVHTINYERNKIIKKYSDGYIISVDLEKTDFKNLYLDKDNIEKITINKKLKTVEITQKNSVEFYLLSDMKLDSLRGEKKISLIILDSIILTEEDKNKMRFDLGSIKEFSFLNGENVGFCSVLDGDVLIITTK